MNIYIEKPNEKLYMINVIDLHMLKQNNMHTSNDVFFFRFHMSCDKKIRLCLMIVYSKRRCSAMAPGARAS